VRWEPSVVGAAALYLRHPVHIALKALHPSIQISCSSEPNATRGFRPDIEYRKNGETFAVLVHKPLGAILPRQFKGAAAPWASTGAKICTTKLDAGPRDGATWFENEARDLISQLSNYVSYRDAKYAALFDWNYLYLAVYNVVDTELIYGTLIDCTGDEQDMVRKAYLGWLMEALENDGKCKVAPPGLCYSFALAARQAARYAAQAAPGALQGALPVRHTVHDGHPAQSSGHGQQKPPNHTQPQTPQPVKAQQQSQAARPAAHARPVANVQKPASGPKSPGLFRLLKKGKT
jgi:hypothetical protein